MARKLKKYKVGINSETYAVSIVDEPAIESNFVALKKDEQEQMFFGSDERHMLYGAALIPDKDIYRNNGEQEFYINFTKESIEKMAQDFMKNYRQNEVTLGHKEQANDITIVESWLVEDPYRDKANALGINVPQGTWMLGMKVNQIDVWDRVKNGELKGGFSVESLLRLEEFSKQNNEENNFTMIDLDEMGFWTKMKDTLVEVFGVSKKEELHQNPVIEKEELEEETPAVEPTPAIEEPTVTVEPTEEPKPVEEVKPVEEPKQDANEQLQELINSLKEEINALKESNTGLQEKVKELGKQPSAQPIKTHSRGGAATGVDSSAYQSWREQMRQMC